MKISPFTPLFFSPSTDTTGSESEHIQTWLSSDRINLQFILDQYDEVPDVYLVNEVTGTETEVTLSSWTVVGGKAIYWHYWQNLSEGYYSVKIESEDEGYEYVSDVFRVTTDSKEVADTVLLQYSNKDNRQRTDAAFWIAYQQVFFAIRVPGGFKDDNWGFSVDNEQFSNQYQDICELYAHEATQKTLTIGDNSVGLPIWYGEFLNRLLCCNYVYVDGLRYCRKDSSVPDKQSLIDGLKSYVFTQSLQQVLHGDPVLESANQVALRYATDSAARTTAGNTTTSKTIITETEV